MKTLQRTFAIIKPDAVAKNATGDIISTINANGFRIIGMKQLHITKSQAEGFYAVHANRPFFDSLTKFMSSGPIVSTTTLPANGTTTSYSIAVTI